MTDSGLRILRLTAACSAAVLLASACTLVPWWQEDGASPGASAQVATPAASAPVAATEPRPGKERMGVAAPAVAAAPTVPASPTVSARPAASAAPRTGSVAGRAKSFSTRNASYTEAGFDALPGWSSDDFTKSWPAFMRSCRVMPRRAASWKELCARAARVNANSPGAIRAFFEREFAVYQIHDDERRPTGVVTGYFEPEIQGSRTYSKPYIYPVYGTPSDLLTLDARALPARSGVVAARVEGRKVVIVGSLSSARLADPDIYTLDLSEAKAITLDKKIRLRAEGQALKPYYTRQEIEALGLPNARVIAFVSSAASLYELQIQGSGRIRLTDGDVIRVSYAEQNGQPFQPYLAKASSQAKGKGVRTRGAFVELELDETDDTGFDEPVFTRGFMLARPASTGPVAVAGRSSIAGSKGTGNTDPSYVFFNEAVVKEGAVGALGVPLTANRSIAVDARSTPLGFPVFVSTHTPTGTPLQRLTLAQDTGGAVRGAVRADYFFGFGADAANQARRMKRNGQMWVLLPRGMTVAAATNTSGVRTRGAGMAMAECLVPDDDICVED